MDEKSQRKDKVYLEHRSPVDVHGVVVHHLHDGHAEVTADAEGDAEAEAAEDGDDVTFGQTATAAVQQRSGPGPRRHWAPVLRQLHGIVFLHIAAIQPPVGGRQRTRLNTAESAC